MKMRCLDFLDLHATLTNFNEAAGKSEVEVSEITNRESEEDNCQ